MATSGCRLPRYSGLEYFDMLSSGTVDVNMSTCQHVKISWQNFYPPTSHALPGMIEDKCNWR